MNGDAPLLTVEVVFAEPARAVARSFRIAAPATVADVLHLAAGCEEFAGLTDGRCAVGIYGRRADPGEPVEEGDRIELYRPLTADPKHARRARARAAVRAPRRPPGGSG